VTRYDVATMAANDPRVATMLDDGWEPFGFAACDVSKPHEEDIKVVQLIALRKTRSPIDVPKLDLSRLGGRAES